MAGQNKVKLFVGFILVIGAFGVVTLLIYMMGRVNMENQKKIASLEFEVTNLIGERESAHKSPAESPRAMGAPVTLKDLVDKAGGLYTEEEKKQKEGFLWIDREAKTATITLGALNGLAPGSVLNVYDGDKKIDTARVEFTYDVISYVKPANLNLEDYGGNYYRVTYEGD